MNDPSSDPAAGVYDPIAEGLRAVRSRIETAARDAGRDPASVGLVAVSKFHPAASVEAALQAGQRVFGENRVQEAAEKFPALRARYPDLKLHLIGGLQTNKVRDAVRLADMIESLDRPALADALARAADREGRLPELLIEVNTGDEPQKFGVPREEADAFIRTCRERFGDRVRGLMCIPPEGVDPTPHFRFLGSLADAHGLPTRSMGMSADFPEAIAEGATLVRVGTAIFGGRPSILARP
ncbi:YggS family pyridoxal phosphate-dependent enzyme [Acetobacter sacchari]|uniref:Pyridoxal phosphate homeostasis protein n=1 Tax=Acetobacter sacchari TaxID=2661687 RepID=A0ABS3LS32_9PROT|nr:YggS family pyridoxal phosphate-dependent enzyme [Acetobacter sacchari]MBO1358723.1 YggS family pyridoxal phosphate-dependent enzyme [Acetobacter sacchari]